MQIYVSLGDKYLENLATFSNDQTRIEVTLDDPSIDLSKLQGYKIQGTDGVNHLVFDETLWSDWQALQEAEQNAIDAHKKLADIIKQQALTGASDTDAASMAVLYPKWSADSVVYKTEERVQYNGKLYKVLQTHTSQATWTPDAASSLFAEVK